MATRKFHRPNTRIEDTTNDVFERFTRRQTGSTRMVCAVPPASVKH